jgi:pilus assembly protein CpaB
MGRRTLLLITSILLAAVGTALIAIYVKGADSRAQQGQELVNVLVVKQSVAAGTTVTAAQNDNSFGFKELHRSDIPTDAMTSTTGVASEQVTTDLLVGQVLQPGMFATNASAAASAVGLKSGQVAVSLSLSDPQRVASMLQPGMSVTIFQIPQQNTAAASTLLSSVTVIKVGSEGTSTSADPGTSGSTSNVASTIITFAVTPANAEKILGAQRDNELSLGVLPGQAAGSAS